MIFWIIADDKIYRFAFLQERSQAIFSRLELRVL